MAQDILLGHRHFIHVVVYGRQIFEFISTCDFQDVIIFYTVDINPYRPQNEDSDHNIRKYNEQYHENSIDALAD